MGEADDQQLRSAYQESIDEGRVRLNRNWAGLFSTGFIGGFDVGIGVLALLLVIEATGSELAGALAFTIGFLALGLGGSELYDENFIVPVSTVAAGQAGIGALVRLWGGTLAANLLGGWVLAAVGMLALPGLASTAREVGSSYVELGYTVESFALGLLGGAVVTLMTWMEQAADSEFGRTAAFFAMGFLVAAGSLAHVVVVSLEMFAALVVGADFAYTQAAGMIAWAALANMVGGLGLVTVLRLVQVAAEQSDDGGGDLEEPDRQPER